LPRAVLPRAVLPRAVLPLKRKGKSNVSAGSTFARKFAS